MADPKALQDDAVKFATLAIENDQKGENTTAIFYYTEAANALLSAANCGSVQPAIIDKANEYVSRAETLKQVNTTKKPSTALQRSQYQLTLDRAKFLLNQAFEQDEKSNVSEAIELYSNATELFLDVRKNATDQSLKEKAESMAHQALKRAEDLKPKTAKKNPNLAGNSANQRKPRPLGDALLEDDDKESQGPHSRPQASHHKTLIVAGGGGYSKDEIQVLRTTSFVNGREYVPFMSVDTKDRFAYPIAYSDKDGRLNLSPKQHEKLGSWSRPEDFCDNPQMIYAISSYSIRQTIVSDCSFVASLAISAQYERRFKKKLITSIIYPQNRYGEPVYNPCGKYMVKLNINGVHRKIVIDDLLPVSRDGDLLCSFSNNRNELWVSLLEKAYMKVMGGYDFPGSNSNIDLHALTGWIPERVAIHSSTIEFDKMKEFNKIQDRFHKGHCLVTMATGLLSDAEADRAGLVPTHAYAMLDIREVMGQKLLMLKNPWNHLRWKGNFSENDTVHWTPELQKACNYDPKSAQMFDNGVFWIDYESLCQFYDVIYINWNPELFTHTTCLHHTWTAKEGPKKDIYNIGDNPQYRLEVKASSACAVWILLTRHITDKDDFAENKEFITVLVYKSEGKRVFYPYDPAPYKDGVRINSPHYLCKMVENPGTSTYTLVISQYEKNNTIHYTLRVYASCEFSLNRITEPYVPKFEKQITGQWKGVTAGGCGNFPTFQNNPIYQIKIDNDLCSNCILVELRGPREYSVGFEVIPVSVASSSESTKKRSSGDYRKGFCVLQLDSISGGVYNIRPTTFYAGKEGPFFLNISTNVPLTVNQLQ